MTVHRAADRQRLFIAGKLTYGGGAISVECTVRDLSSHGARLMVDPGVTLPSKMRLDVPARKIAEDVEVRWRHGDVVGVSFDRAARDETTPDEANRRLRDLEEENAKLRKQVRELRLELANRVARDEASN